MRSNEMRWSEREREERESREEGGGRSTLKVKANRGADDVRMQLD